jgi:hypothetical protein
MYSKLLNKQNFNSSNSNLNLSSTFRRDVYHIKEDQSKNFSLKEKLHLQIAEDILWLVPILPVLRREHHRGAQLTRGKEN